MVIINYRNYIHDYANKVAPLHALTRKGVNVPASWTEEHERAVDELKEALCSYPCLMNVDYSRPYQVRVDACRRGHGLGGVLLQQDGTGDWRPVSWWSRALSPAEKEYSSTELECKALHDILLYYDVYLQGVRFDVFTDHKALIYMVRAQTATNNGRLMRYLMDIQHYDFRLFYKKGSMHLDADAVSRLLKFGETPRYLSADDLEWDKGPVSEEELLVAKDLEAKRRRRILRSESRRLAKGRTEDKGATKTRGGIGTSRNLGAGQDQGGEWVSNAVRRMRLPPQDSQEDQQSSRHYSRYPRRVRQIRSEGPKVREAAGWDSFEGKKTTPAE